MHEIRLREPWKPSDSSEATEPNLASQTQEVRQSFIRKFHAPSGLNAIDQITLKICPTSDSTLIELFAVTLNERPLHITEAEESVWIADLSAHLQPYNSLMLGIRFLASNSPVKLSDLADVRLRIQHA